MKDEVNSCCNFLALTPLSLRWC